jgi:hypothetical protein
MDGDLTLRQSAAARLERRLVGIVVHWQSGHASLETADGKVYCFITRDGGLAMKLPSEQVEALLESGQGKLLVMGQRTMREWFVLPDPDLPDALKLLKEAKAYVESLPKNERKPKAAAKKPVSGTQAKKDVRLKSEKKRP